MLGRSHNSCACPCAKPEPRVVVWVWVCGCAFMCELEQVTGEDFLRWGSWRVNPLAMPCSLCIQGETSLGVAGHWHLCPAAAPHVPLSSPGLCRCAEFCKMPPETGSKGRRESQRPPEWCSLGGWDLLCLFDRQMLRCSYFCQPFDCPLTSFCLQSFASFLWNYFLFLSLP